jgi:hypothetical protein
MHGKSEIYLREELFLELVTLKSTLKLVTISPILVNGVV